MTRARHPLLPAVWLLGIALAGLATGYLGARLSTFATASPESSAAPATRSSTPSATGTAGPGKTSPPMITQRVDYPVIGENLSVNPEAVTALGLSTGQTSAVAREVAAYRQELVKTIAANTRRFPRFDDPTTGRIAYYYEGSRNNAAALVLRDRLLVHLDQPAADLIATALAENSRALYHQGERDMLILISPGNPDTRSGIIHTYDAKGQRAGSDSTMQNDPLIQLLHSAAK